MGRFVAGERSSQERDRCLADKNGFQGRAKWSERGEPARGHGNISMKGFDFGLGFGELGNENILDGLQA